MKSIFLIKEKNYIIIVFLFQLIIILYNINFCSNCNITHPIRKFGECISTGCSIYEFKDNVCIIENDIIKTQLLTNIIIYTREGIAYANLATTPDNNLMCISSYLGLDTTEFLYGLKSNGRDYFFIDNKETPFNEINSLNYRNEGVIYGIKLSGGNKEYIIAFGDNYACFQLFDFENNNNVYQMLGMDFFQTSFNIFHYASIFRLNTEEN